MSWVWGDKIVFSMADGVQGREADLGDQVQGDHDRIGTLAVRHPKHKGSYGFTDTTPTTTSTATTITTTLISASQQ